VQKRCLVVKPAPIWIRLCAGHAATIDSGDDSEDPDFWRWADAMLGGHGRG
jgi:hypothetical protein